MYIACFVFIVNSSLTSETYPLKLLQLMVHKHQTVLSIQYLLWFFSILQGDCCRLFKWWPFLFPQFSYHWTWKWNSCSPCSTPLPPDYSYLKNKTKKKQIWIWYHPITLPTTLHCCWHLHPHSFYIHSLTLLGTTPALPGQFKYSIDNSSYSITLTSFWPMMLSTNLRQ